VKQTMLHVAIGATALTGMVAGRGARRLAVVPLPTPAEMPDGAARFAASFAQLRGQLETAGHGFVRVDVRIALLPPHAEARLLRLPPLRNGEAAAVVRRDAGRYFMSVAAPRIVAVAAPPRGSAAPVLAAAAGASLTEDVRTACQRMGWCVRSISAAHAAWTAAAVSAARRSPAAYAAVDEGTVHVVRLADAVPVAMRRVPADAHDDVVAAAGDERGDIVVFTDAADGAALVARLEQAGWTVRRAEHGAAATAALYAGAAAHAGGVGVLRAGGAAARRAGLHLVAASEEVQRRSRDRRLAAGLVAACVLLLAGAAWLELWSAGRQLDTIRSQRAAIRADVEPLLALRDSIEQRAAWASELESAAAAAPYWTTALFDLALLLPPEAHVNRLFATADTLIVEAEGARAGAALQALRSAGSLRDVRLLGVVDRELADGATTVERFRMSARLVSPPAAAQSAAPDAEVLPQSAAAGGGSAAQAGAGGQP
jgi:hypothetical protein